MCTEDRQLLSTSLRKLVTGRMTNDEFDDLYYDHFYHSSDVAIQEIGRFGWSLYSSDLIFPYRLTGKHALPGWIKKRAAHAILFLHTEQAYEYPRIKDSTANSLLIYACCLASLLCFVSAIAYYVLLLVGAALFSVALLTIAASSRSDVIENGSGLDLLDEKWPFANDQMLAETNGSAYVLGGFGEYERNNQAVNPSRR